MVSTTTEESHSLLMEKGIKPELIDSPLIYLNQTFLCFDLESEGDAKQEIEIRRSVNDIVAWRMRTNAPTRYIVNPNSGYLHAGQPDAKITIQLVDNNFHPSHELILQAIRLDDFDDKGVWKSERAKTFGQVQTIKLELSTTIVSFDNLQQETEAQQLSLSKILMHEGIRKEQQVKELKELLKLLDADCQAVRNNMAKAQRLKEVLCKNLADKCVKLDEAKKEYLRVDREVAVVKQKIAEAPSCVIT